jgi:hypothetical protein
LSLNFPNRTLQIFYLIDYSLLLMYYYRGSGLSQPDMTGRPMGRHTIGPASSALGMVWPAGISLSHRALATPVAGRAQYTLTRLPGVQCFLRHIGVAGFRVGCALCQEAVRQGWVEFRRTRGSRLSPLPSPYGSCSDETRL